MHRAAVQLNSGNDESLPGFVFHPTDEELVRFYLHKKIKKQIPFAFKLIPQLDIYKYDPWDLPKISPKREFQRDWYFFCQRDRKYRNSPRPNRVCFSGYWKATGTDRPVYSSHSGQCIGLKKSLVFYRGKAAKGIKTNWMMHEFRLPDTNTHDINDPNWTICRILKKQSRSGNMVDSSTAEDIRDDANSSTPLVDSPQIESFPSSPPTNSPHITSFSSTTITNSPAPKNNPHNYQSGTDIVESLLEPSSVPYNTKPSLTPKLNQRQSPLVMNQIDGFWSSILLSSPVIPMGHPSASTYEWPQWNSFAEPGVNERHPSDIYTPSPQVGSVLSIWDYPSGLL